MNYIYLIEAIGDHEVKYKIGFTKDEKNLKRRLKSIQTGNPYKCKIIQTFQTKFDRKVEISLHNQLKSRRREGEWFDLDLQHIIDFEKMCQNLEDNFSILEKSGNPFFNKK